MDSVDDIESLLPAYVYWDVDRSRLDILKDRHFILTRMFERGKLDDVLTLIIIYGQEDTSDVLKKAPHLSRSGIYLAHTLLNIPLVEFAAYTHIKNNPRLT